MFDLQSIFFYFVLAIALGGFLFLLILDKDNRRFSLYIIYILTTITISTLYLSQNRIFVTETGRFSASNAAYVTYLWLHVVIIAGLSITSLLIRSFDRELSGSWRQPTVQDQKIAALICSIIALVELFNVLISYPNGFWGGSFNRARFFEDVARLSFLPNLFGVLAFFLPVIGTVLAVSGYSRSVRWVGAGILAMYFAYQLGIGQVFHGILFPASVVFGVYSSLKSKGQVRVRIPVKTMLIAGVVVVIVTVQASFSDRGITRLQGSVVEGVFYRLFVLQGASSAEIYQSWFDGIRMNASQLLDGRQYWIEATMPRAAGSVFLDMGINLQGAISGSFLAFGGVPLGSVLWLIYGGVLKGFAAWCDPGAVSRKLPLGLGFWGIQSCVP